MKKISILCLLMNSSLVFSQTPLIIEGTIVNNSVTGDWSGVNIQRNVSTALIYRNNAVTSQNVSGYMLQAGDELPGSTSNNLQGEIISGNKFTWNGTDLTSITHGIFTGYNKDAIIRYNYLNKVPMGIIRKSDGMTNDAGGVAYNIINNPVATGVVVKGMSGVNIFNNTFYSSRYPYDGAGNGTWRGLVHIYSNDSPVAASTGTKIRNNIFYTKNQIYNITIADAACAVGFESDYNVFYCESGTPMFNYLGTPKTFAQWQALGYDLHSVVKNPAFIDLTSFVPASRLDYGVSLGTEWQSGLSVKASWVTGSSPATSDQNGKWQVGARIYGSSETNNNPTPPVQSGKIIMTIYPNPVHGIMNVKIEPEDPSVSQGAVETIEIIRVFDISGSLQLEKMVEPGVVETQIPVNLKSGIYVVQLFSGTSQVASQKIIVY